MNVLGVIPARGGSKGIARKNIRPLAGRPLLAWTIDAARAAKRVTRLVVSTEDPEIAEIARQHACDVVDRPAVLAEDTTRTEPVLLHALDVVEAQGFRADAVMTLEPTAPLRSPRTIDALVERLERGDCDAAFTVAETRAVLGRIPNGIFVPLFPNQPRRRQEREPLYEESGTAYVTRAAALRATLSVLGTRPAAIVVPPHEAVDINTPFDLTFAEALIKEREHAH